MEVNFTFSMNAAGLHAVRITKSINTCVQLDKHSGCGHNLVTVLPRGRSELESGVLPQLGKPALQGGLVFPLTSVQLRVELAVSPYLPIGKYIFKETGKEREKKNRCPEIFSLYCPNSVYMHCTSILNLL